MAFADGEVAQVRAATDIVAIISEVTALKKAGVRWEGLCPFHAEKTPSFSVNAAQGYYHCFGCGVGGDAITFVRETQGLDFRDALQFLADKAGIELQEDEKAGPQRKERTALLDAMARAVDFYHDRLLHSPDAGIARQYLRSRGIDGETVRNFKLGWAPDEWDALATYLKVTDTVLTGTGLGFRNSRNRTQDFLRARVIFPIFDTGGRPIAVGGRILPGAPARADGRTEAKYKNSPETAIYSKRRTLYGLNLAKDNIIKSNEIIVCEGYTDVIGLFQVDLPRAVATCGTALTEDHFRTLKNFATRIVLAYDADGAGQNAAASVYQWEKKHDVEVAVVQMPEGMDPGQMAQNDPDLLRRCVAEAIPFLQFRLNRVLATANVRTAEGRAAAAERAVAVIAEHPIDLVRDQYLLQIADTLRVDVERLRTRASHGPSSSRTPTRSAQPSTRATQTSARSPLRSGVTAIQYAVHAPEVIDDRFALALFADPVQRMVFEVLADGRLSVEAIELLQERDEIAAANLLSQIVVDDFDVEDALDERVTSVIHQLVRSAANDALREVERDLRLGSITPDSALTLIKEVKAHLADLDGAHAAHSEAELRAWLIRHDASRPD
jgi:DNA primase